MPGQYVSLVEKLTPVGTYRVKHPRSPRANGAMVVLGGKSEASRPLDDSRIKSRIVVLIN